MPSQENGNPGTIVTAVRAATPVAILSSTNATPIVVQTSAAHGRQSGDAVHVSGHLVNTNANGEWIVTVVDGTHLALTGITPAVGNGVGGATGHVQALSMGATFAIISDGTDDLDASNLNPPPIALADRTAASALWTGAYKLAAVQPVRDGAWQIDSGGTPAIWAASVVGTGGTWVASNNGSWVLPVGVADGLCAGDLVDIEFTGTMAFVWAAGNPTIGAKLYVNNVPLGGSSSFFSLPGSAQFSIGGQATAGSLYVPITLRGQLVLTDSGLLNVKLYGFSDTNTTTVDFIGDYQMTIKVLRPTAMPQ
jgi:hypothetical protein